MLANVFEGLPKAARWAFWLAVISVIDLVLSLFGGINVGALFVLALQVLFIVFYFCYSKACKRAAATNSIDELEEAIIWQVRIIKIIAGLLLFVVSMMVLGLLASFFV